MIPKIIFCHKIAKSKSKQKKKFTIVRDQIISECRLSMVDMCKNANVPDVLDVFLKSLELFYELCHCKLNNSKLKRESAQLLQNCCIDELKTRMSRM